MTARLPGAAAAMLLFITACGDALPSEPVLRTAEAATEAVVGRTTFMTRNLYVGADADAVVAALVSPDQSDDLAAVGAAAQTLARTDFVARLAAIADEIASHRPHAVALQEVSTITLDLTGFGVPIQYHADFLPVLLDALSERGLDYAVAGSVENIVAEPIPGVSLRDYDVVLVDAERVEVTSASGQSFAANVGPVAPGVELKRGYVLVEAVIAGEPVAIVGTHLEPGAGAALAGLRALQAQELAAVLAGAPRAVVLGDLNDGAGSPMYQVLTAAGFEDTWAALRGAAPGLTCCHLPDLANHVAQFGQRIDYALLRGFGEPGRLLGSVTITGDQPADRLEGALGLVWPSDHAGVAVSVMAREGRED